MDLCYTDVTLYRRVDTEGNVTFPLYMFLLSPFVFKEMFPVLNSFKTDLISSLLCFYFRSFLWLEC